MSNEVEDADRIMVGKEGGEFVGDSSPEDPLVIALWFIFLCLVYSKVFNLW